MPENVRGCTICLDTGKNADVKQTRPKTGSMAPEDRRQQVLDVLEQSGVAMKGVDVFRNCKLRGATFERRTTKNYLSQLLESGDVIKVDSAALNNGELNEVESKERGHFIAASVAEELRE